MLMRIIHISTRAATTRVTSKAIKTNTTMINTMTKVLLLPVSMGIVKVQSLDDADMIQRKNQRLLAISP